jgi:integrase
MQDEEERGLMSGDTRKVCSHGRDCLLLRKDRRHGRYELAIRIDTTETTGRQLKRAGYATRTEADAALDQVRELVKLAGADDGLRRKIGDMIFAARYGRPLPSVEDVRRKLGAGREPDSRSLTLTEWLDEWIALRKRVIDQSTYDAYGAHIRNYLKPYLGGVQLDKLTARHVVDMLDRIDARNDVIRRARDEGTLAPDDPCDPRHRVMVTSAATQRQTVKVLRAALTYAVKKQLIERNVAADAEMPRVEHKPAKVWTPDQTRRFLEATRDDRLHALWRITALRGLRQSELLALTWADVHLDGTRLTVRRSKTRSGVRDVSLDAETVAVLRRHRKRQAEERLATFGAYDDHDLVFCREDGSPFPSRQQITFAFKRRAREVGLPVIRFHDLRHTAATLNLEAGVDIKVVSDLLGHANTRITQDIYQHVRQQIHVDAAEKVVELLASST